MRWSLSKEAHSRKRLGPWLIALVAAGAAAVSFSIEEILRRASFIDSVAGIVARGIVDRVAVVVIDLASKAVAEAVLESYLERIEEGLRVGHVALDRAEIGIDPRAG